MTSPLPAAPVNASPWDGALDAFLDEKGDSGSRRTVESYGRMLRRFFADLAKTPERVTPADVHGFAHGIGRSGRPPAAATVGARIACLSSYYRFLLRRGLVTANPCDLVERPSLARARRAGGGSLGRSAGAGRTSGAGRAAPASVRPAAAVAAAWPTPIPLGRRAALPGFPVACLPEWLAAFVRAEASATQTPPDMAAMFALAGLATVAAGRVWVEPVPGWLEGLNLFIAVAMEPGSRKSAVHRAMLAPIVAFERLLVETAAPDIAAKRTIREVAQVAQAKLVRAAAATEEPTERAALEAEARTAAAALERLDVPASPRLVTADVTPEKLASMLHEGGGRMAVLSAEGGIFDQMAGRYSGGIPNLDVYLAGHAGDPIRVDRRGRPAEYVERPALTIGVALQPYHLARLGRIHALAGRGLLDRFLYALPAGTVGYRETRVEPVAAGVARRYDTSLRALAATCERLAAPLTLVLSPDAAERFGAWRAAIEPRRRPGAELGHIGGWSAKLDGAVARIAGLLHVAGTFDSERFVPISEGAMAGAIDIGHYLIEHALAAFDEMGAEPAAAEARRLLRWLAPGTTFSQRDCVDALRSRSSRGSAADAVLALLTDHGHIRALPRQPGAGRTSRRYEVHPAVRCVGPLGPDGVGLLDVDEPGRAT